MKTIEDKLTEMLVNHGLFESQAKEVMAIAIPKLEEESSLLEHGINYKDSSDSFPIVIYNILFTYIKPITLDWIIENKPMAWYRAMFE